MKIRCKITSGEGLAILFGGILLLVILFNILSGLFFGYIIGDVTADKRYRLSSATKEFLDKNEVPLTIRLYVSKDLKQASSIYGDYAEYVNRLLNQYVENSHNLIKLELVEITPYSSTEMTVEKFGLRPLELEDTTHSVYLGANIIRVDSEAVSIPVFDIERKSILEDDISRTISVLTGRKKFVIGIISPYFNIASLGNMFLLDDNWSFIRLLNAAGFAIKPLSDVSPYIPEDVDAVLVFYPVSLKPFSLYAIDQYLLRGGNVMVMMDSFSEIRLSQDKDFTPYNSGMQKFLDNLGITYYEDMLIGDLDNNQTVISAGRTVPYPFHLRVYQEQMTRHPVMNNLHELRLNYGSLFNFKPLYKDLNITPLFKTGFNSSLLPTEWVYLQTYDAMMNKMKSENFQFSLALLVEGNFRALYKRPLIDNGPLLLKMPVFINKAEKNGKLLLVSDSDMVGPQLWKGGSPDGSVSFYSSDNFFFIRNALDYLTSSNYTQVGQKFISRNKINLNNIILAWAKNRYADQLNRLKLQLNDVKRQINQFYREDKNDNELKNSIGRQKKIYDLQNKERTLEQTVKEIDYYIQGSYHKLKIWFAVVMMILPALLSVLLLWMGYRIYQFLYQAKMKGKFNE